MSKRFDILFWPVSFLICAIIYRPALGGQPIWDDLAYWIFNPEMNYSFFRIWREFSWPLSMSVQKLLLSGFGEQYWLDHIVCLSLHFLNSHLVFRLANHLRWPKPRWIFLLFLLHPANVISVAWMIQIKTLLCFFFAALSFFAFEKGLINKRWFTLAFIFFAASMLSKTASIALPLLFFFYASKKIENKKWLYLTAAVFCLFSVFEAKRLLDSSVTQSASEVELDHTHAVLKTTRYYLEQSIAPIHTEPVKGRAPPNLAVLDFAPPILIGAFVMAFGNTLPTWTLVSGILMLLPFLGFVSAPFMKITWVSDQHLYLALPFLLATWIFVFERFAGRFSTAILAVILVWFAAKSAMTTPYFENEDAFYQASLLADSGNVVMVYNYATTLAYHDRTDEAYKIANALHEKAEREPGLKTAAKFSELEALRLKLIEFRNYKLNQH